MISPSIGRIVWFRLKEMPLGMQPLAAIVTYVHSDHIVNLAVFSREGVAKAQTSVVLLQDNESPDGEPFWCEWMPYQKGQAAKYEELEKKTL